MEEKTIDFINKYSKYLRLGIVVSVSLAFYNIIQATIIELNNPGMNAFAENNFWAYFWMGISVLFSLPLLYRKLEAIESYYNSLQAKCSHNDQLIGKHVAKAFINMITKNIPQIIVGIVFAVILYFVLSTYVITPDIRTEYLETIKATRGPVNLSSYNFSDLPNTPVIP